MKVTQSIRILFSDQREIATRLKKEVDSLVLGRRDPLWHYESRVKKEESFALKLETGRVPIPTALEDFFACTLVVRNLSEVDNAIALVEKYCDVLYRRPAQPDRTHKHPDKFPFDDLRLYVKLRCDGTTPEKDIHSVVFEFQIKTFLQHAWSIATHDLIYKTNDVSWSKQRIAYQVKAMLEHAEVTINEAAVLSLSPALAQTTDRVDELANMLKLLRNTWPDNFLPLNINRLAQSVCDLLRGGKVRHDELEACLQRLKTDETLPTNLSPFAVIVKALAKHLPDKLLRAIGGNKVKFKLVVPAELDLPAGFDKDTCPGATFL